MMWHERDPERPKLDGNAAHLLLVVAPGLLGANLVSLALEEGRGACFAAGGGREEKK